MAYFGLSKPYIAKLGTSGYTDGFQCGKAVKTTITPNTSEGRLFADNMQAEYVAEFQNATLSMGVDRLPVEAAKVMFGHTVTEDGQVTYKSGDASNYVGYGFIVCEILEGVKKYRACILPKVKFNEGEDSYETKGDSITFATPELSGQAMPNDDYEWKIISKAYDTEAEAEAWIKTELDIASA